MAKTLRWYQLESVDAVWNYFHNGKVGNPLVVMPTGTGKSLTIAALIRRLFASYGQLRVMKITHSKHLVEQNAITLKEWWRDAPLGIYSAGLGQKEIGYKITYCGIDSVVRKAHLFGHIDMVMIDECHMCDDKEDSRYQKFFMALREVNPKLVIVGFTATPWRAGLGILTNGDIFDDVVYDLSSMDNFNKLFEQEFLSPLIPLQTKLELDVSGVRVHGGEFVESDLQEAVDKEHITRAALDEAVEKASDRNHWLIFASGVEHCDHITEMLNSMGVSCVSVHSKNSARQNDENVDAFKRGDIRALCNVGVLTTGFDAPFVDLIILLRPTKSTVLHVQILGRGLRIYPGKVNCLVLDYAGNVRRCGPINDPLLPKRKGEGKAGVAPVKTCPQCGCICHCSVRQCDFCGKEFLFEHHLDDHASGAAIIKKPELPEIVVMKVDFIQYSLHQKKGKPPILKVSYASGLRMFSEWICLEHDGYASKKAREWWRRREPGAEPPTTVDEALKRTDSLIAPSHVRVWINKELPEIMAACFDGTAFNSQEDTGERPIVEHYEIKEDVVFDDGLSI